MVTGCGQPGQWTLPLQLRPLPISTVGQPAESKAPQLEGSKWHPVRQAVYVKRNTVARSRNQLQWKGSAIHLVFVNAFSKLRKATISFNRYVCLSVCPPTSDPTGRNLTKFYIFYIFPLTIVTFIRCGGVECGTAWQTTNYNIIRHMRYACWITKATNTPSPYVILLSCDNNGYANATLCLVSILSHMRHDLGGGGGCT
jgi:hypothetical protein